MKMNTGRKITECDFQALLPWFCSCVKTLGKRHREAYFAPWIAPWTHSHPSWTTFTPEGRELPTSTHLYILSNISAACSPTSWRCWMHFQYLYFCYPHSYPTRIVHWGMGPAFSLRMRTRIQTCACFVVLCSKPPIKSHFQHYWRITQITFWVMLDKRN